MYGIYIPIMELDDLFAKNWENTYIICFTPSLQMVMKFHFLT